MKVSGRTEVQSVMPRWKQASEVSMLANEALVQRACVMTFSNLSPVAARLSMLGEVE